MASVFLSYDHDDAALSKPLISALEKASHTVWFDRHIHGGAQYSRKIEQALDEADAVVVLWSPYSLESAWVRDEAAEGRDRGKLIPWASTASRRRSAFGSSRRSTSAPGKVAAKCRGWPSCWKRSITKRHSPLRLL